MEEVVNINLVEEDILICINTLRDVLNEMCCTVDDPGQNREILRVSRQMDRLIVDYMSLRKKRN